MRFRLVWSPYHGVEHHPDPNPRKEYLGSKNDIWSLWWELTQRGFQCEIYSLDGQLQNPEEGLSGIMDYNP